MFYRPKSELLWPFGFLVRLIGLLRSLAGRIIGYLGMLARLPGVARFVRFRVFAVRFDGFIVVLCCFVVVMFRHYADCRAFQWPPRGRKRSALMHPLVDFYDYGAVFNRTRTSDRYALCF